MRILIAALLLMTALAGCAEGNEPLEPSTSVEEDAGTDQNETVEPVNETVEANVTTPANTPPTANLTADAREVPAGTIVRFDILVDDADGDNLTWELDADGDGTMDANGTEPGNVTYSYGIAGTYVAVLNVTDGRDVASTNVTITVLEVALEPGMCPRNALAVGGQVYEYTDDPAGGTWYFLENNDEPGLQIMNNFLVGPLRDIFWNLEEAEDCVDGDQMIQ